MTGKEYWQDCCLKKKQIVFQIDRLRLEALAVKYLQLILCTSCVLVSCNLAGKNVAQVKDFKTNLKNEVIVITNDVNKRLITLISFPKFSSYLSKF